MRKLVQLRQRRTRESKIIQKKETVPTNDHCYFRDLDEMLSSLGVAPVSEVLSSLSSVNSATPDQSANHTPDASLQPALNGAA